MAAQSLEEATLEEAPLQETTLEEARVKETGSANIAQPQVAEPQVAEPKSYVYPIHRVYRVFQNHFRPRRKRAFMQRFPEVAHGASVLDVGGTVTWWESDFPKGIKVAVVNVDDDHRDTVEQAGFTFYKADGRTLPFADRQFDLVFSNSVIEHVGSFEDQKRFAAESVRCGKKLYLQTPNKWFPIEPHMMTAFIQWLPFPVARRLVRYCSLWGLVAKPTQKQIDEMLLTTRLLSKKQLQQIFPTARVTEEKFLGLAKSFIVLIDGK